jgi:hypothetical protein
MTIDPQCEAYLARGPRCHFAAKHFHRAQTGHKFHLCDVHLRTILRRERIGSDEEKVRDWLAKREAV